MIVFFTVLFTAIILSPAVAIADVKIPNDSHIGFSGLEYHVPRNTRTILYKYKSQKNKSLSEAGELEAGTRGIVESRDALRRVTAVDHDVVADCSISIGNISKPDIFSPKQQVVIIEGDVINLGNCK